MSDHSPYRRRSDALKVTVSICFCYTLCFFLVGSWLRAKSRSYKWDDAVAVTATVSHISRLFASLSNINFNIGAVPSTICDCVRSAIKWSRKIYGVSVHQLTSGLVELGITAPLALHSS